jgi:putative alpha-1,2-mannosidase
MRRVTWIAILLLAAALSPAAAPRALRTPREPQPQPDRLTSLVNPFIGTGGHGHTFPGPSLPFGMIQPGPDTRLTGWDSSSGYHHSDSKIVGFSHTHLSGTGIPDYNDVLLMPTTKDGTAELFTMDADGRPAYASSFSHDDEQASPGYYAVTLKDSNVRAELTTTTRVGVHRYAYPTGRAARVVLDLTHRDQVLDSSLTVVNDHELSGHRRSRSWAQDQRLFYVIRFSRPFKAPNRMPASIGGAPCSSGVRLRHARRAAAGEGRHLHRERRWRSQKSRRGTAGVGFRRRPPRGRCGVGKRTGPHPDLRRHHRSAHDLLHRALSLDAHPNVAMDVDGQYRGMDRQVHRADGFTYYSVFSLWDTFRTLHPLLTLIDRARTADFVKRCCGCIRTAVGFRYGSWPATRRTQ